MFAVLAWIAVGLIVWLLVGAALAVLLGKAIHRADVGEARIRRRHRLELSGHRVCG